MDPWDRKITLGSLPDSMAARMGSKEGLTFKGQRWTFLEMAAEIDRLARGLIHQGILPGDHVCIWLNNCPEWVFAMFALAKIGAVQIPLNTRFRHVDLAYVLKQSDCSTLITHDTSGPIDYLGMVRGLVPMESRSVEAGIRGATIDSRDFPQLKRVIVKSDATHEGAIGWGALLAGADAVPQSEVDSRNAAVNAEDTLFMMYTSGTTGFPKGVLRNHSLIQNQRDRIARMQTSSADVFLNYLPLFHIFGYVDGPMLSMMQGTRQVLMETFDPDEALDLVASERVTQIHGFETHCRGLVDAQRRRARDLSSLRVGIFVAGMHSATQVVKDAKRVLAPIKTMTAYGMTEVGQNAMLSDVEISEEQRCETSGYPCEGFQIRVVDPHTGADQPHGIQGEMIIKTYNMMQGYYNKPEETAAAFDDDGWFHTGDAAYTREDGYIRFVGRNRDMLKIGGENVDPVEVESYLQNHPGVHKVSVVGFPDERLSEVPVAFIQPVTTTGVTPQSVIDFCKGNIASYKIPRHVLLVEDFPVTASGKVQKVKLREQALQLIPET